MVRAVLRFVEHLQLSTSEQMADRNAALQQFLSITGVSDVAAAQSILEAANWDVDVRFPKLPTQFDMFQTFPPNMSFAQPQSSLLLSFSSLP